MKNHDGFQVFVDSPLALEATTIFQKHMWDDYAEGAMELVKKGITPIGFDGLRTSVTSDDSKNINFDPNPKVILSASGGFAKYSSYLIGDILTVGRKALWTIGIVLVAAYVLWALLYNQLLLLSVNRSLAASRGVRVMLVENIFVIMVAVAVMVSIRWVGILMINSLLILPAAAARNITSSAGSYHWTATVFGLLSSVVGLWVSYSCGTSAGATMVLTAAVLFFLTYLIGKSRK